MSVIWEACAGKKWCVHIPFDGDKCLEARACIRVIVEGTNFFLEIEIAGVRQRIPLGNSCVEARYYVFAAKACLANVSVTRTAINFDVVLRLCIDANIGPIHIGECVDVYSQHVTIGISTVVELAALGITPPMHGVSLRGASFGSETAYAYVETGMPAQARDELAQKLAAIK